MIIREAKNSDIDQIIDFQLKMALETEQIELNSTTVKKGVNAVILDSSKGRYYVAEKDGKIIGSLLTTYEWSDWRNGTILWIQSVYILPEYRRKGVYRKLYSHIKDLVNNDSQLNGIRLYADKTNHVAHKTYSNLGMNQDHYITFEWMK
jgi:GNAT superfamily N-acetyltransferase